MNKYLKKISLSTILSIGLALSALLPNLTDVRAAQTTVTFEAESSYNINQGKIANHSGCSGGQFVGFVGNGNILQFNNIYVEADGLYNVTVHYFSDNNRHGYLKVNDNAEISVNFTGVGNWYNMGTKTLQVNLKAGNNTLKFYNDYEYMPDFDRITVEGAVVQAVIGGYEAEATGNVIGGIVKNHSDCSGGKYVVMNGSGNKLQFNNIYAPSTGIYNIAIYYYSQYNRNGYISVNGETGTEIIFRGVGNWDDQGVEYTTVFLQAGNNSIKFYNDSAYMPDFDRLCIVGEGYLLNNPGLEESNGINPYSWSIGSDHSRRSTFQWESGSGINGSKCISINATTPTDAYWEQTVRLEPGKNYIFKGYIKGENLIPESSNVTIGANLSVVGDFCHSGSGEQTFGTFDWKEFSVYFQAPASGEVTVACRLGNWWNLVSGKVMFDNLTIVPDNSLTRIEGNNIYLNLEITDLTSITSTNLNKWVNRLDSAYEAYEDLVGFTPYNGEKMGIISTRQYPGGWAVAGNPIKWYQIYVSSELANINNYDDWSFGILHEIGHNFDIEGWNFNAEFWANTKMYYIVEALNAKKKVNNTEVELAQLYRAGYFDSYTKTILPRTSYHHDALTYCFIRIKDRIGIEPFKATFRHFVNTGENPPTNIAKFNRFLELLQENYNPGGNEVESTFPSGELNYIRNFI